MGHSDIYLYSPLSSKAVQEAKGRALLMQFILLELFRALHAKGQEAPHSFTLASPASFLPFDWSSDVSWIHKLQEHIKLLPFAFPDAQQQISSLLHLLKEVLAQGVLQELLQQFYTGLEPFLIACKDSEALLLFLLQNRESIETLSYPNPLELLLETMHPGGMSLVAEQIRSSYESRGFKSLQPEIDRALAIYEK